MLTSFLPKSVHRQMLHLIIKRMNIFYLHLTWHTHLYPPRFPRQSPVLVSNKKETHTALASHPVISYASSLIKNRHAWVKLISFKHGGWTDSVRSFVEICLTLNHSYLAPSPSELIVFFFECLASLLSSPPVKAAGGDNWDAARKETWWWVVLFCYLFILPLCDTPFGC